MKDVVNYNEDSNINDYYKLKKDWRQVKNLVSEIEEDIEIFLSDRKVRRRSKLARAKLIKARALMITVGRKLLKTRQDFDSDYS